jgi:hypothetical protein
MAGTLDGSNSDHLATVDFERRVPNTNGSAIIRNGNLASNNYRMSRLCIRHVRAAELPLTQHCFDELLLADIGSQPAKRRRPVSQDRDLIGNGQCLSKLVSDQDHCSARVRQLA